MKIRILLVIILALVVSGCDKSPRGKLFEECRRNFGDIYTPAECKQYEIRRSRIKNEWNNFNEN